MFYFAASWSNFDSNTWVYDQGLVPSNSTGNDEGANYATRYGVECEIIFCLVLTP